jgi:hypothetical protein
MSYLCAGGRRCTGTTAARASRGILRAGELLGHDHAVQIRQMDVEQNDLGPQDGDGLHGPCPVRRLTDNVEALGPKQRSSRRPKGRMVIHDEHGGAHAADRPTPNRELTCGQPQSSSPRRLRPTRRFRRAERASLVAETSGPSC